MNLILNLFIESIFKYIKYNKLIIMALRSLVEIALHIESFRNIDL